MTGSPRPKSIAIFSPYATVAPHFETELEIAQQHLDLGDTVEFIGCLGGLQNCDFNHKREPERCQDCLGRREMGLENLQPAPNSLPLVIDNSVDFGLRTRFDSTAELIQYKIDDFDIGYAALSSLVSICRDPDPDLGEHAELLKRFIVSAWMTYQATLSYIESHHPDRVYVFNGRFAAMRAVLRACQSQNVDCWVHERGCDLNHYDITRNHLIHEIDRTDEVIRQYWNSNESTREEVGTSWFHDRVNRIEKNWHSFVKEQESGLLPIGWDEQQKNISIFCSSDDEFVAIGDCWKNSLYPDQVDAVKKIAADLHSQDPKIQLYVRVHPNVAKADYAKKREMMSLDLPNVTIIGPTEKIDTYQLMRASDIVASFGSSVGIEAVFWDRPSVLLGPCLYMHLGGTYQPKSHEETIRLLNADLELQDKTGALMYGFWLQTRGRKFEYFEPKSLFEGTFKGKVLYNRPPKKRGWAKLVSKIAGG